MAIHRKDNGKWLVDIVDERGKRIQRTFKREREATAYEGKIIDKKYLYKMVGLGMAKLRYPIEQALNDFERTKINLRPASIKKYSGVIGEIRKFIESLNIRYVDEFTADHATSFFNVLTSERIVNNSYEERVMKARTKTINFYLLTLKAFFKAELLKDHILKDPTLHLRNVKVERKKPAYYSKEELQSFFAQKMDKAYKNAFKGFLHTGCRFSELANLEWQDINFEDRIIVIKSTEDHKTKTEQSERLIPMSDNLYNLLVEIKKNPLSDRYPFCTPKGSQLRERRLLEVCKRVAKDAGIKSNAFIHKFRATFATHLLQKKVSIESIKALLGHKSIVETEIYADYRSDHLHQEVKILDKII